MVMVCPACGGAVDVPAGLDKWRLEAASRMVLRCANCRGEVVALRSDLGRSISCAACGAKTDVPATLDFQSLDAATTGDLALAERSAAWLAVSFFGCCLFPLAAWVAWSTSNAIRRADTDGRSALPALRRVRAAAVALIMVELAGAVLIVAPIVREFGRTRQ
jgi:DNA-directed RNA polymerase subunit RPC12/RpoP